MSSKASRKWLAVFAALVCLAALVCGVSVVLPGKVGPTGREKVPSEGASPAGRQPGSEARDHKSWVTFDVSFDSAAKRTVEVLRGVFVDEAKITKRDRCHMSTYMEEVGHGGGYVTFARCSQRFSVAEVLTGRGRLGELPIEYGYVEKAEGGPLPSEASPIPKGARVVLALGVSSVLLKAIPDTDENRRSIEQLVNYVARRPPAAKALIAAINSFTMKIEYHGHEPGSFYSILCTTRKQLPQGIPSEWLVMQNLSDVWAYQALDYLARAGLLDPTKLRRNRDEPPAKDPCYTLSLSAEGTEEYTCNLGWGKPAFDRLEGLANAIQYDGGKMAKLLERLEAFGGKRGQPSGK